jgi:hypothetical protein
MLPVIDLLTLASPQHAHPLLDRRFIGDLRLGLGGGRDESRRGPSSWRSI